MRAREDASVGSGVNNVEPLVRVSGITKTFGRGRRATRAVHDVSFEIYPGERVGLVGESGSGKSTTAGIVCGLTRPDSGSVRILGRETGQGRGVNRWVWRHVQMVFQDPYTSLNPWMTVRQNIMEPLRFWRGMSVPEASRQAELLLDDVGLAGFEDRNVESLSGGQRQRASIGRALAVEPEVLVLDESVSALDVSVQAQVLSLFLDLQRDRGLAYLLVSHDLGVIRLVCDRVLIMKNGRIVEECTSENLTPEGVTTDYARELLSAVPALPQPPIRNAAGGPTGAAEPDDKK